VAEATEWVTIQEAADRLKVSKVTIYRWAREGLLAIYKFGPKVARVRWQDVEAMAQARQAFTGAAFTENGGRNNEHS
jgi:excisionase family DNA binding protein